jgi:hypothetical protein
MNVRANTSLIVLVVAMACVVSVPGAARGEIVLSAETALQLQMLTSKAYSIYPVDQKRRDEVLQSIDAWVELIVPIDEVQPVEETETERTWVWVSRSGVLIGTGGHVRHDAGLGPVRIKYTQETGGRRLVIFLRSPTSDARNKDDVAKIASEFLRKRGFVVETARDRIDGPEVVDRKTRSWAQNGAMENETTVLQRVIFGRRVDGLGVFNSRQIVDLHPSSPQILAFKSLAWAPLSEDEARTVRVREPEEILDALRTLFPSSSARSNVTKVESGWVQKPSILLPVVAVSLERRSEADDEPPVRTIVLIPLDADEPIPERQRPSRLPEHGSKSVPPVESVPDP